MAKIIVGYEWAPAAWASYLINGDASGLSSTELHDIRLWLQWLDADVVGVEETAVFRTYPPIIEQLTGCRAGDACNYITHQQGSVFVQVLG